MTWARRLPAGAGASVVPGSGPSRPSPPCRPTRRLTDSHDPLLEVAAGPLGAAASPEHCPGHRTWGSSTIFTASETAATPRLATTQGHSSMLLPRSLSGSAGTEQLPRRTGRPHVSVLGAVDSHFRPLPMPPPAAAGPAPCPSLWTQAAAQPWVRISVVTLGEGDVGSCSAYCKFLLIRPHLAPRGPAEGPPATCKPSGVQHSSSRRCFRWVVGSMALSLSFSL